MKQVRCLSSCLLMLSISIACSYAANIPSKKGMTVKGIVTDTRKSPISGVVVTDGVHFTQTDEKGYYYLSNSPVSGENYKPIQVCVCVGTGRLSTHS